MKALKGRHFLTLLDFSREELESMLELAKRMRDEVRPSLKGKILALLFQKPSTRTRVSFEAAMSSLGGSAIYLSWGEAQLARGETIADTARTLSQYVDAVAARVYRHETLEEMARASSIPIVNALSDRWHPCQALSDIFTMEEIKGQLQGLKLAWIGDSTNVCNSLLVACATFGIDVSIACPEGYEPLPDVLENARSRAAETGAMIKVVREPSEAVRGADIVYTDTLVSMGYEAEREERLRVFLPKYQVTAKLLSLAKDDAIFMHCLPALRGEEVTDEVLDGARSVVWQQARNRLYVTRALLASLI